MFRRVFGDTLPDSNDPVELNESLVFVVVCVNVEEIELVSVLGLLSGSRALSGRLGVVLLASQLMRRGAFGVAVFTRIAVAWLPLL